MVRISCMRNSAYMYLVMEASAPPSWACMWS
jgi:hypothetical protein